MYDEITNKETFDEIKNFWYDEVKACAYENVVIGIFGNKADSFENENVSEDEAKQYAKLSP